jgi:Uma2 family endonuclease
MSSAAVQRVPLEDPTVYPVKDDMGDPTLQFLISLVLVPLIRHWLALSGKRAFVGANTFFYWKQYDPSECVAPDIYVLPGVPLSPRVGAWKIWETGKVPSFALEVVSQDVDKDYLKSPPKYDRMGVAELVVFDPDFAGSDERVQWQVFRRIKGRGLVKVEATNADRVRSRVLGCFLRVVGDGDEMRLRIGTGPAGETLLPTDEEARAQAEAEREQAEAKREQAEAEREQAKAERDEARAAQGRVEAELAELRATLASRGRRKGPAVKR